MIRVVAPCLLFFLLCASAQAQNAALAATVYNNQVYIVGAENKPTGLFIRSSGKGEWEHRGAPNTKAFDIAMRQENGVAVWYLGAGNGLHVSVDSGEAWKLVTPWEVEDVLSIALDKNDFDHVVIGTSVGVFVSNDGCKTWKEANAGLVSTFVSEIVIDYSDKQVLYCSTEGGVHKSPDNGETWSRLPLHIERIRTIAQHPSQPQTLAVGTEDNGVFITRNGGATWQSSQGGLAQSTIYTIVFDASHSDRLYAAGYNTGIWRGDDLGRSWTKGANATDTLVVHALSIDVRKPAHLYAATIDDGVWQSTDGGETWRQAGLNGTKIWSLYVGE